MPNNYILSGSAMKRDQAYTFSMLTQMYSLWQQFQVPVTFYHYFLNIIKNKSKHEQTNLMQKQITSLKIGSHMYLKIKSSIEARQNSLSIIKANLHILKDKQTLSRPLLNIPQDRQVLGYRKLFQTKESLEQRNQSRKLRQLANHLILYRKITLQIIFFIHKWMLQMVSLGYEGLIQFFYKNENYLEEITEKTMPILEQYSQIFELNPFFMLKRQLAKGQYALVYDFLKISTQYARNLYEALKLLSQHHTDLMKNKMLENVSFNSIKQKIRKSNSVDKLYANLLNGKQYSVVKNSFNKVDKMSSKHVQDCQRILALKMPQSKTYKKIMSPPKLLNPQIYSKTKQISKIPSILSVQNNEKQISKRITKHNFTSKILKRRTKSNLEILGNQTDQISPKLNTKYKFQIKSHKKQELDQYVDNELDKTQPFQIAKSNQKKSEQRKTIISIQSKSGLQNQQSRINIEFSPEKSLQQSYENYKKNIRDVQHQGLKFEIQKNIKSTQILCYLKKLFLEQQQGDQIKNKINFQQIQKLAKFIITERQNLTFYRITSPGKQTLLRSKNNNRSIAAWIVCKLYKDHSTLQKTVDLIFLYQFKKIIDIKMLIISYFKELGYYRLKQNGKVINQVYLDKIKQENVAVIRIKYKVSPAVEKQEIKSVIKNNQGLKMSRILKYYSYSKTSRYHRYCQHRSKQMSCSINYYFQQACKVFINNKSYIKVKINSITRQKQCYQVYHHLNNTFLVIAFSMNDLKAAENNKETNQMEMDSSFDKQQARKQEYKYVCFEESKTMRKYVNERQKPVISEFIWIENNIPEVRSIAMDKKDILLTNTLVISQPYLLGIFGKDSQDKNKSLAILDFTS